MRRLSPVIGIFLTVFLDLLSFGLVIPDIQLRGEQLGADGLLRGLLIASFSIAQFLTAPLLGRWSDTIGRRKILLVTSALAVAANLLYAHASLLWIMMLSRVILGIAGANLGVAYAYIADVTKPEDRAKSMGLIGAAFGLGFIFGPPVGAWLVTAGGNQPVLLGYVAAGLALVNFIYISLFLPESSPAGSAEPGGAIANFRKAMSTPGLGLLLILFFLANLGFAQLESTYFLLIARQFGMSQIDGAWVLMIVGIVMAFVQGYLIRIMQPKLGEVRLLRIAWPCQVIVLALVPFTPPWIPLLLGVIVLGFGSGLAQPSLSSLISRTAPASMQGGIFGVTQGLGAMARIFGPMIGNALIDVRAWLPYALASALMAVPMFGAWRLRQPEGEAEVKGFAAE